tara:strand:+ start:536 stop:748 length:213 start_codon:yes stop_codon:yes gene_type:complete
MNTWEQILMLGNAGALMCILYCFFQWLDPVANYLDLHLGKRLSKVGFSLYILGMLLIFGSVSERMQPYLN